VVEKRTLVKPSGGVHSSLGKGSNLTGKHLEYENYGGGDMF